MEKRRLADDRTAIQDAIDILTKLTDGHSVRMVHGVSTRQLTTARDELAKVLDGLGRYAQ